MPPRALEAVLRYAYVHGYTCEQWAEPTKECLQRDGKESANDLCELLLSRVFAQTRVNETLLERYLTFAVTGTADLQHNTELASPPLISPETFLLCLFKFVEETVTKNPYQWSHILKLLPAVLTPIDGDQVISDLLNQQDEKTSWSRILSDVFIMLARIVAVGLYRDYYVSNREHIEEATTMDMNISTSVGGNTQPNGSSLPFNFLSQASAFDPDATIYFDTLQEDANGRGAPNASFDSHSIMDTQSTLYDNDKIEISNAVLAAQIMVELIEKKSAKRIFEVMNSQQRRLGKADSSAAEPWTTCQAILTAPTPTSTLSSSYTAESLQNTHIQKLLLLVSRLTDRDLDQRLAVHLKYHELEDEGTARALPSAGLMGFIYYLVQVRPMPSEEYIVDYLMKLQTIKGAFDESFFLELWFIGLTGLREASTAIAKQEGDQNEGANSNNALTTNCLLWRTLVLTKIPRLISQLQLKSQSTVNGAKGFKAESIENSEHNALECSLSQLKTFSGLLNGCTASSSAIQALLLTKDSSKAAQEDEDDFMKLLDVKNDTDFDTPALTDALRTLTEQDIFESIVSVCEHQGLVRSHVAHELVKPAERKQENNPDDFSSLLDTDMLEVDDASLSSQSSSLQIISQNLDQRISALRESVSKTAVTGLFRIALTSMFHADKVIDFIISLIVEKAENRDVYSLAKICEAIIRCPSILDIIGFMYHPSVILNALNKFCTEWSPMDSEMDIDDRSGSENDNDDGIYGVQVLYDRFGKIWTLINMILLKYNLYYDLNSAFPEREGFCYQLFTEGHIIYGRDANDPSMEQIVQKWQNELQTSGMISDELLRTSTPQQLLTAAPTLFWNLLLAHETMGVDVESLADAVSLFQKPFLSFALIPCSIEVFCEQLQGPSSQFAIQCLERLLVYGYPPKEIVQICGKDILASLGGLAEQKRQERLVLQPNDVVATENEQAQERLAQLQKSVRQILGLEEEGNQMRHTETITTNVTSDNLFAKTREMFRSAVKSGRSMFMRDVDADTVALWDPSKAPKQSITHYLDFVMFQVALDVGGQHWFISMIVEEVLEAGKSGGAVRAAELGSCLLATPLAATAGDQQNRCSNLLRCLLQDIIPPSLKTCAENGASFFQGQTLGVFVSNCLVLMHDRDDDKEFIHALGRIFFETLVIDSENAPHIIHPKEEENTNIAVLSDYVFAQWPDVITESPVWRGFIKGLMSNPLVNEAWPNTFI